jgi:hypothetical protein
MVYNLSVEFSYSPIHHQPPPCTPRPLRGSAFGLRGYSCAIPAPHSHTPSSHPTNSTIAETNLNSPNNVFSLPFSLTSQTATRRLSITHPCSSDFPFFGFVNPPRSALAPLGVFASLWVANPRKGRIRKPSCLHESHDLISRVAMSQCPVLVLCKVEQDTDERNV